MPTKTISGRVYARAHACFASFDVDAWRDTVLASNGSKRRVFRPEIVREAIEAGQKLSKTELVKKLRDETGVGKARAYSLIDEAQERRILQYDKKAKTYALS